MGATEKYPAAVQVPPDVLLPTPPDIVAPAVQVVAVAQYNILQTPPPIKPSLPLTQFL